MCRGSIVEHGILWDLMLYELNVAVGDGGTFTLGELYSWLYVTSQMPAKADWKIDWKCENICKEHLCLKPMWENKDKTP